MIDNPDNTPLSDSDDDGDDSQYTFAATPDFLSSISPPLSAVTTAIRRSTRSSLRNRLHSIYQDSLFVQRVSDAFGLPLVPNARAGDWYVQGGGGGGGGGAGGVYFKSTDGHAGQWRFSLRRLNLGVLDLVAEHGGVVIVDSTRRGKRFPDSLSKTVPIWIAVMNRVLFPERESERGGFHVNPQCVGDAEARQIELLLDEFVYNFLSLELDLSSIKSKLKLPLRPIWISPASPLPASQTPYRDFSPVVLLSASRMVPQGTGTATTTGGGIEGEYIQGAGDDHEAWAAKSGLTPEMFWSNHEALVNAASEQDLVDMIRSLSLSQKKKKKKEHETGGESSSGRHDTRLIRPTTSVFVVGPSPHPHRHHQSFDLIIDLSQQKKSSNPTTTTTTLSEKVSGKYISSPLPPGKRLFPALRIALPHILAAASTFLTSSEKQILITTTNDNEDSNNNDVDDDGGGGGGDGASALCVALAVLSLYYDDAGKFVPAGRVAGAGVEVDKKCVRKRLAWIVNACPNVQVPRGALNSVNSFLMKRP